MIEKPDLFEIRLREICSLRRRNLLRRNLLRLTVSGILLLKDLLTGGIKMKRFGKLLVLLLALAFCFALLPVSAAAETYTFNKKSSQPWCFKTIIVSMGSIRSLSCDGVPLKFAGINAGGAHSQYDVILADQNEQTYQIRVMTSFLLSLRSGTHTFLVTDGPDAGRSFDFVISGMADFDFPPATPTDLGGSDEPDEVLRFGGMSGAGVAETKGGKPLDSEAAAAPPAARTRQAAILPENAPTANPSTGAAL